MKVPLILLDLSALMAPGWNVSAGGLRWTMGRVGWLECRTPDGAKLGVTFDVGVVEDAAVVVVVDDVLIGGFDSTGDVQNARLRQILERILPQLASIAAGLRHEAVVSTKIRNEDGRARQRSALRRL